MNNLKSTLLKIAFCLSIFSFTTLQQSYAQTFTVNSLGDTGDANAGNGVCDDGSGNCTLRAAIQEVQNGGGGPFIIDIGVAGTINASGAFSTSINKNFTINGDAAGTTIDFGDSDRMFEFAGGNITFNNLIIQNCSYTSRGGVLHINSGVTLTANNCVFHSNTTTSAGGAIYIRSGAHFIANESTFTDNTCGSDGGAIHNRGGTLTATNCTITGNSQDGGNGGGGISSIFNSVTNLTNCSIIGNNNNNAQGAGGLGVDGILNMTNCILWGNTGGNGDFRTINCCGDIASGTITNNIVETCFSTTNNCATYNFISTDPQLGAAQTCGLQTYFEPQAGSVAIDGGTASGAPANDICGTATIGASIDIGSFEVGGGAPAIPTMGEWAMIIFALIIASFGVVTVMRWQRELQLQATVS